VRMMLLTAGTRGDVEPFAALARAAAARGHDVRLAVPDDTGASLSGVDAVGLDSGSRGLIPDTGVAPWRLVRQVGGTIRPALRRLLAAAARETAAFSPDLVVHHPLILSAPMAADALGVPRVLVELAPVATASAAFPAAGGPTATYDLGRFNRATYAVPRIAARLLAGDPPRPTRHAGGRARTRSRATLMAASPQLLPRPADWPQRVHLTGMWSEPAHGAAAVVPVDAELAAFVRDGAHLVATFGSMTTGDARARAHAVIAGARERGLRTLLLTGWGGLDPSDALDDTDVLARRAAPLDVVLRGAAVAVHHGGAGTSHAVARAGVPSVVVPVTADQPFWAERVHRAGIAAEPVPPRRLSPRVLEVSLGEALTRASRAAEVGALIRREDGLGVALDVLESL